MRTGAASPQVFLEKCRPAGCRCCPTIIGYAGDSGDFGLARFLPSEAEIGSFTPSPNPVISGSSMTLTASDVTDEIPSATTTQVAFYVNINGSNTLPGCTTRNGTSVWTCTFKVNLAPGTCMLFAQTEDRCGVFGDLAALKLTVQVGSPPSPGN
jgi:hypothetical protein